MDERSRPEIFSPSQAYFWFLSTRLTTRLITSHSKSTDSPPPLSSPTQSQVIQSQHQVIQPRLTTTATTTPASTATVEAAGEDSCLSPATGFSRFGPKLASPFAIKRECASKSVCALIRILVKRGVRLNSLNPPGYGPVGGGN